MRFYLRGRLGRHIGWVLPLGGTRVASRTPRAQHRAALSRPQRIGGYLFAAAGTVVLILACAGIIAPPGH
jgi:hypothetical protein